MSQSSVASRGEGRDERGGDGRAPRDVTPVIGDNITLFVLDERRSARAQPPATAPRPGAYLHEWPKRKFETRRLDRAFLRGRAPSSATFTQARIDGADVARTSSRFSFSPPYLGVASARIPDVH